MNITRNIFITENATNFLEDLVHLCFFRVFFFLFPFILNRKSEWMNVRKQPIIKKWNSSVVAMVKRIEDHEQHFLYQGLFDSRWKTKLELRGSRDSDSRRSR